MSVVMMTGGGLRVTMLMSRCGDRGNESSEGEGVEGDSNSS